MSLGPSVVEVLLQIVGALATGTAAIVAALAKIEENTRPKK